MRAPEKCYTEKPLYEELQIACRRADKRRAQGLRYKMITVIIVLVMGFILGQTSYRGVDRLIHGNKKKPKDAEENLKARKTKKEITELLSPYLDVSHGLPRYWVFSRVLSKADPVELTCTIADFIYQMVPHDENAPLPHTCLDGKAVRASENKAITGKNTYIVNVVYAGYALVLYHIKVGAKSQEAKCIEAEIENILLGNPSIITMDAMGTKKAILKLIVQAGGNAVLPVKSNNRRLEDFIRDYMIHAILTQPELVEFEVDLGQYTVKDAPAKVLENVRCKWFEEDNRSEGDDAENVMNSFTLFDNLYGYPEVIYQNAEGPVSKPISPNLDPSNSHLAAVDINGRWVTMVYAHGRYERREYELLTDEAALCQLKDNPVFEGWDMIQQIGLVTRYRATLQRDKDTKEEYYALTITRTPYLMTKVSTVGDFSATVRSHWAVEQINNTLDTIFDEDHCKTRAGYGTENCSLLKKLAYNLIQIRRDQERAKGNDLSFADAMALFSPAQINQSVRMICAMFTHRICSPYKKEVQRESA